MTIGEWLTANAVALVAVVLGVAGLIHSWLTSKRGYALAARVARRDEPRLRVRVSLARLLDRRTNKADGELHVSVVVINEGGVPMSVGAVTMGWAGEDEKAMIMPEHYAAPITIPHRLDVTSSLVIPVPAAIFIERNDRRPPDEIFVHDHSGKEWHADPGQVRQIMSEIPVMTKIVVDADPTGPAR